MMANDRLAVVKYFYHRGPEIVFKSLYLSNKRPTPFFCKNLRYSESCKPCGIAVKKWPLICVLLKKFRMRKEIY